MLPYGKYVTVSIFIANDKDWEGIRAITAVLDFTQDSYCSFAIMFIKSSRLSEFRSYIDLLRILYLDLYNINDSSDTKSSILSTTTTSIDLLPII